MPIPPNAPRYKPPRWLYVFVGVIVVLSLAVVVCGKLLQGAKAESTADPANSFGRTSVGD